MERIDVVIGVVALVALVGTVLGVSVYQEPPVGAGARFTVLWSEAQEPVPADSGSRSGAGTVDPIVIPVGGMNISRLVFAVNVQQSGPNLAQRTATINITGPQGQAQQQPLVIPTNPSGPAGATVTMRFFPAPIPSTEEVSASDNTTALRQLNASHASVAGVGEWTVRVSVSAQATDAGPSPGTITVTPVVTRFSYMADVTVSAPDIDVGG